MAPAMLHAIPGEDWKNDAIIPGNSSKDNANIMGITPAGFTFKGRYVDTPPYILFPRTRFAYETGIFLLASVIITTPAIMRNDTTKNPTYGTSWEASHVRNNCLMLVGRPETMPAKITRETPLPIPFSVISSPIHMRNIVPAVIVRSVGIREMSEGCSMICCLIRIVRKAYPCKNAKGTVSMRPY